MNDDEIIQLDLGAHLASGLRAVRPVIGLLARVVRMVSDLVVANPHLKATSELRSRLEEFSKALDDREEPDVESLAVLGEDCIAACEDFFGRTRKESLNRENEFIEIIDVLIETVRTLKGHAEEFNGGVIGASARFEQLQAIDDLRDLQDQIRIEAKDLARRVERKQQADRDDFSKLAVKVETLQDRVVRVKEDSILDPLTQVANRSSFDRALGDWAKKANASGGVFSLAMLDLDDFKRINDQYGHQIGDRVLLCAAQILGKSIRLGDFVARCGGDEFAVLLRGCALEGAEERFNRLISDIASTQYEHQDEKGKGYIRFTASCGIAEVFEGDSPEKIIRRADQALYEAKRLGKNRVVGKRESRGVDVFHGRRLTA